MRIKCLLVDDEPLAIKLLQHHFQHLDQFEVTATCQHAVKAHEILCSTPIDLMFIDIKMPQLSGIEFLRSLQHPPKTIITTAYREFALDGYELGVIDYLLKPITFDRFFKAIDRFRQAHLSAATAAPASPEMPYLFIKSGAHFHKLFTDDICYIESIRDYIKVHTTQGTLMAKYKIGDLETEVSSKGLLRVHRSFIINLKKITAFSAQEIMIGKQAIPIGANYKAALRKVLPFPSSF